MTTAAASAELQLNNLLLLASSNDFNNEYSTKAFRKWFLQQFTASSSSSSASSSDQKSSCSVEDFAIYFLNAIRQGTEIHLQSHTETDATPQRQKTPNVRSLRGATSNNVSYSNSTPKHSQRTAEKINDTDEVLTIDMSINASPVLSINSSLERSAPTSMRRVGGNHRTSVQGNRLLTTTPNSADRTMSSRNNSASSSLCLGDFLDLNASMNCRSNRKKSNSNVETATTTSSGKPKKRVVPITIMTRPKSANNNLAVASPFGGTGSSSFSEENNIIKMAHNEVEDKDKCSIVAARKSLKMNFSDITKELEESTKAIRNDIPSSHDTERVAPLETIDLTKVTQRPILNTLADIYSMLIDLNYAANFLHEIAFLLNILNANDQPAAMKSSKVDKKSHLDALRSLTNCVYFALRVLSHQRHQLALLDVKSLGVVLSNERIIHLATDLQSYLYSICQRKQQLIAQRSLRNSTATTTTTTSTPTITNSFKNVHYQSDKDSRQYFTTNDEFCAFRFQRDHFYKTLKLWESNHLNPTWNFATEVTPKIHEIFAQSETPVNMAHFASLFVAQLLISSSNSTSPEEIGLTVDEQKFNKLTQRLVALSNFSVDYQFPRNEAFFRDFIVEARSIAFSEQLKMALYSELIKINESKYELLNLHHTDNNLAEDVDEEEEQEEREGEHNELIVRPEVLASMLTLAKFLGFVTAQPFMQRPPVGKESAMVPSLEEKQLLLRSLFQPHFNVCQLLEEAIANHKLLITLPWLVQYLSMLDSVTLKLDNFTSALRIIFTLYTNLDNAAENKLRLMPTSRFIVRCCLGWLFETKPSIAEQYYAHRAIASQSLKMEANDDGTNSQSIELSPMLECILNVACPFLAEFRVSIMPAKYANTKYASRTGRYRHITTRIAELNFAPTDRAIEKESTPKTTQTQGNQRKLIEAFLHSQNSSMHRLIEFLTERTYKSVVKDAQYKILLPSKSAADNKVNMITSTSATKVSETVAEIYSAARQEAIAEWNSKVPQWISERIEKALDALLPIETTPIVKRTYSFVIRSNVTPKVKQWQHANVVKTNFYCSNLDEMTQKICKANRKRREDQLTSELRIVQDEPSVSEVIDELQYWLHCTTMRPDLMAKGDNVASRILTFFQKLQMTFDNILPTAYYRLMGAGIVQLAQNLIVHHTLLLTHEILTITCQVWLMPQMQDAIAMDMRSNKLKKDTNGDDDDDDNNGNQESSTRKTTPSIYDGLLTVPFIKSISLTKNVTTCFAKLTELLIEMINQHVITVEFVNIHFVPIFKEDWQSNVFQEISNMLQAIVQASRNADAVTNNIDDDACCAYENDEKSHLFMEVLADLSRDIDNL